MCFISPRVPLGVPDGQPPLVPNRRRPMRDFSVHSQIDCLLSNYMINDV
jgi:hypothetical protein